ncbi:MAG TPA: pyridoxamine 5'-phosphate oxidase family protein [Ilumatobacteraceae bacterium]
MRNDNDVEARPLEEMIESGRSVVMFMTMIGDAHSSRPLTVAAIEGERLSFLVDRKADWMSGVGDDGRAVHVTFADHEHNTYLSLNGVATVDDRPEERQRLWTPIAKVWFDGVEDPRLTVLRFDVTSGEWWKGPSSTIGEAAALLWGIVTGDDELVGDHGVIAVATSAEGEAR